MTNFLSFVFHNNWDSRNHTAGHSLRYVCSHPGQLSLSSLRSWYMRTSFGWEGKGRYGSFR